MNDLFSKGIIKRYLNNAKSESYGRFNVKLGNIILQNPSFYVAFQKERRESESLIADLSKVEFLFSKCIAKISRHDVNQFSVKFTVSNSFIIKFNSGVKQFKLEVFLNDEDGVGGILSYDMNEFERSKKVYGTLDQVLGGLSEKIEGRIFSFEIHDPIEEIPTKTFAQTA